MSGSIYQNEWASIARMLIALQRDLRTTLLPREVGVVDGFMLEALLLRIYLWQLEGTAVTVSMLSRSLGVSRATCRRKLATLIEWGFIKLEGQTYRIVAWMGEADQRRMLNRITAILNHATTEMTLAKLATSVAH
jgi:predicted DNA-binding transcriptional regulator